MTDLSAMWDALARYQPFADADGHGESWKRMCEERTIDAAVAAVNAARAKAAWAEATYAAASAASWAESAAEAEADAAAAAAAATIRSARAIERIEDALKERNND